VAGKKDCTDVMDPPEAETLMQSSGERGSGCLRPILAKSGFSGFWLLSLSEPLIYRFVVMIQINTDL